MWGMANPISTFDLCVIGAGVFGSAASKHAAAFPNLKVCLIGPEEPTVDEWGSRTIFGSHYDEGRIVSKGDLNDIFKILVENSMNGFLKLEEESGLKLYNNSGCLYLYKNFDSTVSRLLNDIKNENSRWIDVSSKSSFSERFPFLNANYHQYAFLDTSAGYISPRKLLSAQKMVFNKLGVHNINDVVQDITQAGEKLIEITTESHGAIFTQKLLICAGAFTNFIPFFRTKELIISVNKETYILMKITENEAAKLSNMPAIDVFHERCQEQPNLNGAYILPPIKYPDGKYYLKIGHKGSIVNSELKTLEEIKNWYNSSGNEYVFEFYSELLRNLIPGLKYEEMIAKTCVTCSNPSYLPYIDKITPNVTVSTVGNGSGVAMCEEVGRMAATLCVEGEWDFELPKSLFEALFR